jgi:hypothetical protein
MVVKALFVLGLAMAGFAQSDRASLERLDASEIRAALTGNLVHYSPPGWADAGAHEEFHPDGKWGGMRYGRGPMPFSGQWDVRDDQLCVHARQGLWEKLERPEWFCRTLWRDTRSGALRMDHIAAGFGGTFGEGLQTLTVQPLPLK